nr:pyridoxal phosphate-dependent aminotransferase [Cochlodiniinecator piscidefendens]
MSCNTPVKSARRIQGMGVSKILELAQVARDLKNQGASVIDLSAGLPDFETPEIIGQAAKDAIDRGETRYTAIDGTPELKAAIREKFRRENGLVFANNEVMASAGAKQVLYNAFMATLDPGDEVILPTPCWLSYFDIVQISGGVPMPLPTTLEAGFKITPAQLRQAITPRSRWVLLNSPSNPSGAVYSAEELNALLDVISDYPNLAAMADDVYEHMRFTDAPFATPAALRPDLRDRILTVNAVSKAYAMTGWRLGYCAGPADLLHCMKIVQSQSTSSPSSISQAAAVAALAGPQNFVQEANKSYRLRRDVMIEGLAKVPGIECRPPDGAFYAFVRVSKLFGLQRPSGEVVKTDTDLTDYLLEAVKVVTVPGSEFGLEGHLRLSFASEEQEIKRALVLISDAIGNLTYV